MSKGASKRAELTSVEHLVTTCPDISISADFLSSIFLLSHSTLIKNI